MRALLALMSLICGLNISIPSVASAEADRGELRIIYICAEKVTPELLKGEDWETAIVYHANEKKVKLAAGWPGVPLEAKIPYNTDEFLQVEAYVLMDTYVQIRVEKETTMTQLGNKKYPVAPAVQNTEVYGSKKLTQLSCVYYPKNDIFFAK